MLRERAPCSSVNHKFRSRCNTPAKPLKLKGQFFVIGTSTGLSFSSITALWSRAVSVAYSSSPVFHHSLGHKGSTCMIAESSKAMKPSLVEIRKVIFQPEPPPKEIVVEVHRVRCYILPRLIRSWQNERRGVHG